MHSVSFHENDFVSFWFCSASFFLLSVFFCYFSRWIEEYFIQQLAEKKCSFKYSSFAFDFDKSKLNRMTSSWNNASDTLALWKHIWVVVLNALEQTKPKNNKMHEKKEISSVWVLIHPFFPHLLCFEPKKKFVDFVRFASHFHLYIWYRCFAASYFDVYAYILAFEGEKGQSWWFRLISIQRFDVIKLL